jgi:hypothetical protein
MDTTEYASRDRSNASMIARAVIVWSGILVLAILNGGLREGVITPAWGSQTGHVLSTLLLCSAILVVTFLTVRWISPSTTKGAMWIGFLWVVLTLAFEFLAGRYLFGGTWESLLAAYNVVAGSVWPLVPITLFLAPVAMRRVRGRPAAAVTS